jgi:hypothetical protein
MKHLCDMIYSLAASRWNRRQPIVHQRHLLSGEGTNRADRLSSAKEIIKKGEKNPMNPKLSQAAMAQVCRPNWTC